MNPILLDWIGYVASLIVLVSLLMSSIKKLRWINLIGALLFGAYGFLIGSFPTGFMNLGIVVIDVYYLVRMYLSKEYFRVLPIQNDTEYLSYFLDFYKEDINRFSDIEKIDFNHAEVKLYLLRNMTPAGIFICNKYNSNTLEIVLDYAIPLYRDFKLGMFIFESQKLYFLGKGYNRFIVSTNNDDHIKYVKKMGFVESKIGNDIYYTKTIE
ncbi:MAG: hypothetical protein JXR62_03095 [Bacilli bacterium]|nr:hypothetical protein [Bacilli bacterium]